MTQTHIATVTLASDQSTLDVTGIPTTGFTDLLILASLRDTFSGTDGWRDITLKFNNVTTNRSARFFYGTGSSVGGGADGTAFPAWADPANATANTFGIISIYIPNYAGTASKSMSIEFITENNATSALQAIESAVWANSAAITQVNFASLTTSLKAGSTVSVYGISNVNNVAKATGGDITSDGSYIYHTFKANGTFTPTTALTANVLVIAGGGAGGANWGAGGGAGGLLGLSYQALSATAHAVTVGAGGTYVSGRGAQGNNSQVGSLSAALGGGGAGTENYPYPNPTAANGASGGSGGGGGRGDSGGGTGGTGTAGQGNNGGNGSTSSAGGGGGAGASGSSSSGGTGGNGGIGTASFSSWGYSTNTGQNVAGTYYYAGGGGGMGQGSAGAGGSGGGGNGTSGLNTGAAGAAATANTGGGGGGGNGANGPGGNGGSGVVIIRYPK